MHLISKTVLRVTICEAMQFPTTFPVSEPTRLKMGEELGPAAAYSAQVIISVLKFIQPVYPIFRWLPG